MAHQGYMYIEGVTQGEIESALESDLHEGAIPFNSFAHDIKVPTEFGIQKMSPRPIHGPIHVNKDIDETTPDIYRAFLTAEDLTVRYEWYETVDGVETLAYTIKIQGARVISVEACNHDVRDTGYDTYRLSERIGFSYNVIEWTYEVDSGDASFEFHSNADYSKRKGAEAVDESPSRM